jgi:hypothetical protein
MAAVSGKENEQSNKMKNDDINCKHLLTKLNI